MSPESIRLLKRVGRPFALLGLALVAACTTPQGEPTAAAPAPIVEESPLPSLLAYHQKIGRQAPQELARERAALAAQPVSPAQQLRLAMLLGHSRTPADLARAIALLDGVLRGSAPAAVALHPLARVLADHYGERQRLEQQAERNAQQLRESQRRAADLQDKLDALADIERSLPPRSRGQRPASGVAR